MKKALICGAGGFIGAHLAKRLVADGYWVRGVDVKRTEYGDSAVQAQSPQSGPSGDGRLRKQIQKTAGGRDRGLHAKSPGPPFREGLSGAGTGAGAAFGKKSSSSESDFQSALPSTRTLVCALARPSAIHCRTWSAVAGPYSRPSAPTIVYMV